MVAVGEDKAEIRERGLAADLLEDVQLKTRGDGEDVRTNRGETAATKAGRVSSFGPFHAERRPRQYTPWALS